MDLLAELRAIPGTAVEAAPGPWRDVAGFELGAPAAVARPADSAAVAAVIALARARRAPVVAAGQRTAYWRPLAVEGAIVLDLSALDGLELGEGFARCGAGTPARRLDQALRERGYYLPIHPDAFGETGVGAMVATGCTSGTGMGQGPLSRWVTGLEVVTGRAEILRTGAAGALGLPPFLREGAPDLTELFFGAEGGLGVVTAVLLRLQPAPWRVKITFEAEDALTVAGLGRERAGAYDTFRLTREAAEPWRGLLGVISPWSASEAADRAAAAADWLRAAGARDLRVEPESEAARRGEPPAYDARWEGPFGGHAAFIARACLAGLDVNAPYSALAPLLAAGARIAAEQRALGALQARAALYLAPDFANVGFHAAFPHHLADPAAAHLARWRASLAGLPLIPYRPGRLWPPPAPYPPWRDLKAWLDPDGVLNPGLALFEGR